MSSAASTFVHATRQHSQEVPRAKVVRFGSPGWIPMIQAPFNSSCAALECGTGTKFVYRAVPELHTAKNVQKWYFTVYSYIQTKYNTVLFM
jgi:hypothetical protein